MKVRVLVQVDEGTHVAWKERAFAEGRSMSDLARDLIERAVLTERGPAGEQKTAGDHGTRSEADMTVAHPVPPRSVSAVPSVVQDVRVEKSAAPRSWKTSSEVGPDARGLALRDGKCRADVAFGTKCKLCGKVH